jgi:hypothetical protein
VVSSGGTVDADKFINGGGTRGSLNPMVGTNEDFSGIGSGSDVENGKALITLNIAKHQDDSRMFQFEFAQVLTIGHSKSPIAGTISNGSRTCFTRHF